MTRRAYKVHLLDLRWTTYRTRCGVEPLGTSNVTHEARLATCRTCKLAAARDGALELGGAR